MKKLLKTLSLLVAIGIIGFLLGQNYPNAFKNLAETKTDTVSYSNSRTARLHRNLIHKRGIGIGYGDTPYTDQFFQAQFELIRSDKTISKAINNYRLDKLWETDKEELLKTIKKQLALSQVKGAAQFELKASAMSDENAQQLAYAIIKTYAERLEESSDKRRDEVVEKYNRLMNLQEVKVDGLLKKLFKTSKRLGIPYYGMEVASNSSSEHSNDLQKQDDDKSQSVQELETFVKSLQNLDYFGIVVRIITSSRPEAVRVEAEEKMIRDLKETKQNLLANGYGINHPRVKTLEAMISDAEEKLAKYVRDIRDKLSRDLIVSKQALDKFKMKITTTNHPEFNEAKDEYEREYRILKSLKQADLSQAICHDDHFYPLIKIHEPGWTPEIAKIMKARKK